MSAEEKLEQIQKAIRRYYLALDQRQHGGLAQDRAFREIEHTLGMCWKQGEELAKQK